jgi:glycosyltransferase involved in cell wall biosynthesis
VTAKSGAVRKPAILFDGYNIGLATGTGISTYTRGLIGAASSLGMETGVLFGEQAAFRADPVAREIEFFNVRLSESRFARLARRASSAARMLSGHAMQEIEATGMVDRTPLRQRLPPCDRIFNSRNLFTSAYAKHKFFGRFTQIANTARHSIAHWTFPVPLSLRNAVNIHTILDIIPLKLPYATADDKQKYLHLIGDICKKTDRIVTISETSKRDILANFNIHESKVHNAYLPVAIPKSLLAEDIRTVASSVYGAYGLKKGEFILAYGTIEYRKNIGRLIQAYLASGLEAPLVIVGKDGYRADEELKALGNPGLSYFAIENGLIRTHSRVVRLPYVSFSELVALIRCAGVVAFPSIYEGFGLPIVEAMLCDTPVITSNFGAMQEVAGDAALLANSYDVRDLRDALLKVMGDANFAADLVVRGARRRDEFSAEKFMERIRPVYLPESGSFGNSATILR